MLHSKSKVGYIQNKKLNQDRFAIINELAPPPVAVLPAVPVPVEICVARRLSRRTCHSTCGCARLGICFDDVGNILLWSRCRGCRCSCSIRCAGGHFRFKLFSFGQKALEST